MSLPPLLLERLKRRRIIQQSAPPVATKKVKVADNIEARYQANPSTSNLCTGSELEGQEEIIAEDHSDEEQTTDTTPLQVVRNQDSSLTLSEVGDNAIAGENSLEREDNEQPSPKQAQHTNQSREIANLGTTSVIGCPNKYNIYHNCSQFCIDNYSEPEQLTPTLEQQKQLAVLLKAYPLTGDWKVVYDPGVKTFYFWNLLSNMVSWYPPAMDGYISQSADEIRKSML